MAIKISGTTVIDNARDIVNVGDITAANAVSADTVSATTSLSTETISSNTASINTLTSDVSVSGDIKATVYNNTYVDLGVPSGNTVTIDCSTGNMFESTPNTDVSFEFSNVPTAGNGYGCILKVTVSGTVTLGWANSVVWDAGTPPAAPADGETDVYTFITDDGGSVWYGFHSGDAMA